MYTEPQTVTVNLVEKSLPRVNSGNRSGTFQMPDGSWTLQIDHDLRSRNRRTVRLTNSKVSADPFIAGTNRPYSMKVSTTVDHPTGGFDAAEIKDAIIALADWLKVGTNAEKLVGGES